MTATQDALFESPDTATDGRGDWGVWINECAVFANQRSAEWWALFHYRQHERITVLEESIAGGHCHVACASKEDSEWLREHMVSNGVPQVACKVQRLKDALVVAEKRRAKFDAATERVAEFMADWLENRPAPEGVEPRPAAAPPAPCAGSNSPAQVRALTARRRAR